MTLSIEDKLAGCLVGGAIGDAMGLPYEGREGPLQYSSPETWTVSDDTQLTLATCEAIVNEGGVSPESIAEAMCAWFREGRVTGIGASTLKALRELDAGGHWALVGRRGEMAAGNGAAMRVAPLGFMLNPNEKHDRVMLRDICRITHHNEEAYVGALAVVAVIHIAAFERHGLGPSLLDDIHRLLPDSNVRDRILQLRAFIKGNTIQDCGKQFGASGYVVDSVPLALAAATFLPILGFQGVLEAVIECGGDTDTTASIAGQIAGTASGFGKLPTGLVSQLEDYEAMRELASRLATLKSQPYTRHELAQLPDDSWPNRGDYCGKCQTWIPKFAEISGQEESRLRGLSKTQAMKEVSEKTGCTLRWAKIWAIHPNGPRVSMCRSTMSLLW